MRTARVFSAGVAAAMVGAAVTGSPAAAAARAAGRATPRPAAAAAPVQNNPNSISLPRPTGPYLTGTTLVHLRDRGRADPLDPKHGPRELMAQIWYPASSAAGRPVAPYAPAGEAAMLQKFYPVPAGAFTAATHSRLSAPVLAGKHKVVFFYHGLCASRTDTTVIDEQLASSGYVVVALASTHESPAVQFPDGHVVTTSDPKYCLAGGDPFSAANQRVLRLLLSVRVADTRYVLDQLERINRDVNPDAEGKPLPRGLAGAMDTRHVGMYGHSFGGGTAAAVMHQDQRFAAGVDLDGFIVGKVAKTGLRKPFLVMGSDYHGPKQDPSWATFLPQLSGWHRWFRMEDSGHYRFIDVGGSVRKWKLDKTLKPNDPETWRLVFGDIGDRVSQQIVTRVTVAFFERFLRGRTEPILDRPTAFFPQLTDKTGSIKRGDPDAAG